MQYRQMPGSQDKLSILGLGLMRLPLQTDGKLDQPRCLEMLHYAYQHGVNYFDTAWVYHNEESEPLLGTFVSQVPRDKLYLATKLPCWLVKSPADLDSFLERQLERLQTSYIDYYLLHSLGKRSWKEMLAVKVLDWLDRAKADGRIRHAGFSFHDGYPVFRKIVLRYDWDFCQIMLNYLDTHYQAGMNGYRLAVERGLGVIAMEPLRGGKLVQLVPDNVQAVWARSRLPWTPLQRALNWVWNLPGSTVLLSGMSNLEQLQENIRLAAQAGSEPIPERELTLYNQARLQYLHRIAVPCSECRYCLPCPHKVAIPTAFGLYNEAKMFGTRERHLREYKAWIPEESRADKCTRCGICLSKCPQHIAIPDRLAEVADYFRED